MARLSELEKWELLEDAASEGRRLDLERLKVGALYKRLEISEHLDFLNWAQAFMSEDVSQRPPIRGDRFLL